MSKIKQLSFQVEEKHRGEWQPLMIKKGDEKVQKTITTLQEYADSMNEYSKEEGIRYVLKKEKKEEVKAEPKKEKTSKK